MATKNDITGDSISSRAPSSAYRDNYDAIFRKKEERVATEDPSLERWFWEHSCKHDGESVVGKGEACNWCGMKEDGTLD